MRGDTINTIPVDHKVFCSTEDNRKEFSQEWHKAMET